MFVCRAPKGSLSRTHDAFSLRSSRCSRTVPLSASSARPARCLPRASLSWRRPSTSATQHDSRTRTASPQPSGPIRFPRGNDQTERTQRQATAPGQVSVRRGAARNGCPQRARIPRHPVSRTPRWRAEGICSLPPEWPRFASRIPSRKGRSVPTSQVPSLSTTQTAFTSEGGLDGCQETHAEHVSPRHRASFQPA